MTAPAVRPRDERPFDVVLFGATGFTGGLVAEVLAARPDLRWALAGRSREKLEAVRRELAAEGPALAELPLLVADAHDVASLDRLAPEARVVCTTVGPYTKHGLELARACARHGTSYCDLTGEPNFVRAVIDACHEEAQSTRARIVTCAGFDSIPSDLGVFLAAEHARRAHGEGLAWAKVFTGRLKGGASGGTIASVLAVLDAAKGDRRVQELLRDPHSLDPDPSRAPRDPFEDDRLGVRFDRDLGGWTAPFVMASINTRVVRRSNALLRDEGAGYGERFLYDEAMGFGPGPRGLARACAVTAAFPIVLAAALLPPARALLERAVLPAPGEGPSREAIARGCFEMNVLAMTESGRRLRGRVAANEDPGYGATAKMLAETAIALAKDGDRLPPRAGVLTPATALGMRLVERLRAVGMTLEIRDA